MSTDLEHGGSDGLEREVGTWGHWEDKSSQWLGHRVRAQHIVLRKIMTSPLTWQPCNQPALHPGQHVAGNRPASLPPKCTAAVALPLKPRALGRGKDRKQAKFCHPRSVASKFCFPWLFTWADTHAALVPKWQLQDLCPFSCSHFSHLPVGKEHLLQILVCSHRGKNFLRPASTTSWPLSPQNRKGLFYHRVLHLEIPHLAAEQLLHSLQADTENSLPFAWELAEV